MASPGPDDTTDEDAVADEEADANPWADEDGIDTLDWGFESAKIWHEVGWAAKVAGDWDRVIEAARGLASKANDIAQEAERRKASGNTP